MRSKYLYAVFEWEREKKKKLFVWCEVWTVGDGNLVEDTVDTAKRGDSLLI